MTYNLCSSDTDTNTDTTQTWIRRYVKSLNVGHGDTDLYII